MEIIVVTSNVDKFNEICHMLGIYGIKSRRLSVNFAENENTLDEIVVNKAKQAYKKLKKPLIVDDTGVYFTAYKNFPGPYPKRIFNRLGFAGLLKKLDRKQRGAFFKTIICYIDKNGFKPFDGVMRGKITKNVHEGKRDSLPYERIFISTGYKEPVCKMSIEKKSKISHRAKAVRKFAKWFISHSNRTCASMP
ncbi:MAG: non-canonical purine NTP pyrophosphatase [Candidatus Aenigmatarchaeota archaeon]